MELRPPPSPAATPSPTGAISLLVLLGFLTLGAVLYPHFAPEPSHAVTNPEALRQVATKLRAAGAIDEAAALYSQVLDEHPTLPKRGAIAFSLGEMYLKSGQFQKALRWFYQAEVEETPDLDTEISKKIVHCLERLGRVHAAKAALNTSVSLDNTASIQRSSDDPIVAVIHNRSIPFSEIQRSIDDLPKEISGKFSGPSGQARYLKKFVADELLWRKAQKLEYDQDPETQRQISNLARQVVVARLLEKEVANKITVDPADLNHFFQANTKRFTGDKPDITFEQVKPQVEQAYRMMKFQTAYGQLIETELSTGDVKVYADRIPN